MNDLLRFAIPGGIFLLLFILIQLKKISRLLNSFQLFSVCLLSVLLLQIGTIFFIQQQVGDVMLFSDAGYYFRNGVDYYWIDVNHTQYPFFPFLIFFHAIANKVTTIYTAVNFVQILKLLLLLSLYIIAHFIYQNGKFDVIEKRKRVLEFLLNPITYCVILFHGQIDVILIAFFIYASQILMNAKSLKKIVLSGILFAASVAAKTWSVIFFPIYLKFFGWKKTLIIGLTSLVFLFIDVFVYTRMVFGSGFRIVLPAILKPGGPVGIWGISYIFNKWSDFLAQNNLVIFGILIAIGFLIIYIRKLTFWQSVGMLILWVYLIIPNWGVQYLFWIVPLLFISNISNRSLYLIFGGIYISFNYINIIFHDNTINSTLIGLSGLSLWLYILFMFARKRKFIETVT